MRFSPEIELSVEKQDIAKLDLRDEKILFLLGKNARTPLTKIAKKVLLSRDSVKYRIKNLERRKVIYGSRTVIDIAKFGYDSYHVFVSLINPRKEAELEVIKEIAGLPYVRSLMQFHGSYDFEIALIAKKITEFDTYLTEILSKIGKYLQDYEITIITKSFRTGAFPKSFLKNFSQETHEKKKQVEYFPDKKDLEIIKCIRDNAQLSLLDISKSVKLSPDAVSYRLKKLYDSKVILSYLPVINYASLGYSLNALLLSIENLNDRREQLLENFFKTNDNILWAVKTVGRYNVLAYICTQNESDFHNTITSLRNKFPELIKNYKSFSSSKQYKYTYAPDCLFPESIK